MPPSLGVPPPLILTLAALAACVGIAATYAILPRLSEPDPEDAEGKPAYASLLSPCFAAQVALASALACLIIAARTPPTTWLAWSGLAIAGALAVAVDAHTTWIPRPLTTLLAAWVLVGLAVAIWTRPTLAVSAVMGGLALRGFFYLFYLPRRGIGFADVRLMTWIGALTATQGLQLVMAATLAGTFIGAVWGVVHQARRPGSPFPYGPALWAGPFVALALLPS